MAEPTGPGAPDERPGAGAGVDRITTEETAAIVGAPLPVRRRVGSTELEVFPVALSGKVFGWGVDAAETPAILDAYRSLGGNFVDTADVYAGGRSEIMIGRWMRESGAREEMVVATKVGKSPDNPGLSARAVTASVEDSLRRLQTDRIDLLYLHIDDPRVEFDETLLAVDDLIRSGKVRYFGGSDHTGERLFLARIACGLLGVAPLVALQNQYHLLHRAEYEQGLAQVAEQQGLAVMPRFALAGGFLSGRYRTRADLRGSASGRQLGRYLTRRGSRVLHALDDTARAHDVAPATIALAWLLAKPHVVAPVVSATRREQVVDLAAAARVRLSRPELERLDRVSAGL
ncbi:MAG: aldo/keto reductase [Micrococcales bacterium]|nr:aldo/keto reductase [Micrococcales bacterium]